VLQLADAAFHVALFVLGGVVAGVLLEVAFLTRPFDLLGHLDPPAGGEVVELGLEPIEGCSGQLLGRHRGRAYNGRSWARLDAAT
jgi:hypothetical protein